MEQHASAEPRAATTAVVLLAAVALGVGAAIAVADRLELDPRSRERPRSGLDGRDRLHEQPRAEPAGPDAAELDRTVPRAAEPPASVAGGRAPAAAAATTVARLEQDVDAFRTEEERAAAERLATELGRLVRDLEFNAGLTEPTQQTVVPPPAPWRPDPRADGRAAPVVDDVWPRGAPVAGGARVTIRGRNLRASQVMFGATAARIVRAEDDAVTVVAPAGSAGPVVISVTNDDGTYALSRIPFTYRR